MVGESILFLTRFERLGRPPAWTRAVPSSKTTVQLSQLPSLVRLADQQRRIGEPLQDPWVNRLPVLNGFHQRIRLLIPSTYASRRCLSLDRWTCRGYPARAHHVIGAGLGCNSGRSVLERSSDRILPDA